MTAFDYVPTVTNLISASSDESKAYRAAHDLYMDAVRAEDRVRIKASEEFGRFTAIISSETATEGMIADAAKSYSTAVLAHQSAKFLTARLLKESKDLLASHQSSTKLSLIRSLRQTAFKLRELGLEPVGLLTGYGSYSDRDPYGVSK